MSDADATQVRRDVAADVDEIIEHVINANMPSMPYDVYSELFDAVDGLGAEIENLQSENEKLRELVKDLLPFAEVGMEYSCPTTRCCLLETCESASNRFRPCTIEDHMKERVAALGIGEEKQ